MSGITENSAAIALVNKIKDRIESRYVRILFVHKELAHLNSVAQGQKASGNFEDFVFSQIDFSVYKKIAAHEFNLLFKQGLFDYDESFYQKAFNLSRKETGDLIEQSYIKIGPFYVCKKSSALLLSVMRSLHTSLEFAPLLDVNDFANAQQLRITADMLDGISIRHSDDSETKLFVPKKKQDCPSAAPLLCGTFNPLGKPYTITLVPALNPASFEQA